jgi:glycosyltransferase involved in cell wall biosynthesis
MTVRVSFVIPTLNQATFIRRCIDSCLAQQLADAEILVRDGGSTDGTQELLASYGSAIQWVSRKDGGQSDAVNQGVYEATGDIIAWINSDDFYAESTVIRSIVDVFEQQSAADIVYGNGLLVDGKGNALREYPTRSPVPFKRLLIYPVSFVLQPAALFRKSLFMDAGALNPNYHFSLDFELWLRMVPLARQMVHIPRTVARATVHDTAKSVRGVFQQLRETESIKHQYAERCALSHLERLQMHWGCLKNRLYASAITVGLYRPWMSRQT